jgi:hypothetical protein
VLSSLQPKSDHEREKSRGKGPGQKKYPKRSLAAQASIPYIGSNVDSTENGKWVVFGGRFPTHAEGDAEHEQGKEPDVLHKVFRSFAKASYQKVTSQGRK